MSLSPPPPPQEGDHIGLTRKANNALHFYINGVDQGGDSGGDTGGGVGTLRGCEDIRVTVGVVPILVVVSVSTLDVTRGLLR